MFLYVTWRAERGVYARVLTLRTGVGDVTAWLQVAFGRGELGVYCEPPDTGKFIEPGRYSAPGVAALLQDQLPPINGSDAAILLSVIPKEWADSTENVVGFFVRLGLDAHIDGRRLTVRGNNLLPRKLISRAVIAFFALDGFTRRLVPPEIGDRIQHQAIQEFAGDADELISLLDRQSGLQRLEILLGRSREHQYNSARAEAVQHALLRLETRKLVQFDCGNAGLLRRLSESLQLETVIGVEPSLRRLQRAKARLAPVGTVRHGSLAEPGEELPHDATALLIEALPLPPGGRLATAEDMLFGRIGFEWVLCVEGERWKPEVLQSWGASVADRFGYRQRSWQMTEADTAILFRRALSPERRLAPTAEPRRQIPTRLFPHVTVEALQWASTLESFARWTVDPRWLFYLPPGMSSVQVDRPDRYLEHPEDAFSYYRAESILKLVVELKHMGSRAVVIVCRDDDAAKERFGIAAPGCIYTRNGRPFFKDAVEVLSLLRDALSRARFWEKFATNWACFDGELLPWTLKADRLLEETHGEVLIAGETVLRHMAEALKQLAPESAGSVAPRLRCFERYRKLYDHYRSEAGASIRFAPFHLIATEGRSYFNENHHWHMATLAGLARKAGLPFIQTPYRLVPLKDERAVASCIEWWKELSASGAEGVVVKPLCFVSRGRRGLAQPGLKCRGREHLRFVYGPEYDLPENWLQLLNRDALAKRRNKHRRVLKQFALSIEGVERFLRREPAERVEECVRSVLALEGREV